MNRDGVSMKNRLKWVLPGIIFTGLVLAIGLWYFRPSSVEANTRLIGMPSAAGSESFDRIEAPRLLEFPRDHGPHPGFQTEWWYYTGNIAAQDGRRFGYQLTFFRRSLSPFDAWLERPSKWGTNQVYMGHFTLTDIAGEKFYAHERFERGAAGLAGAQGEPAFRVWLNDWSVEQVSNDQFWLRAGESGIELDLMLDDQKGPVLQGDRGYSRKGEQPGNASLYYSQTRLETQGELVYQGQVLQVSGLSWMDREISTSALSEGQVGWDWFSLQFDDGTELMAYVLRQSDGSPGEFSSGIFVGEDGSTRLLDKDDFELVATRTWVSPHSGAAYPAGWVIKVPARGLEVTILPQIADQELNVSFRYWEGSVRVEGTREGKPVQGFGYVELTGYAQSLEGGL